MLVYVSEKGDRSKVVTKAQQNTPLAVGALTKMLENMDWAQDANLITDWNGELEGIPGHSYLHVIIRGTPDSDNFCLVRSVIDINETFGQDTLDRNDLVNILGGLKDELRKQFDLFRNGEVVHGKVSYS